MIGYSKRKLKISRSPRARRALERTLRDNHSPARRGERWMRIEVLTWDSTAGGGIHHYAVIVGYCTDYAGGDTHSADLSCAFLPEANLANANLQQTHLERAWLIGAKFDSAVLIGTVMKDNAMNSVKVSR